MKKGRAPGCLGDLLGMKSYPAVWGLIIMDHDKDPY